MFTTYNFGLAFEFYISTESSQTRSQSIIPPIIIGEPDVRSRDESTERVKKETSIDDQILWKNHVDNVISKVSNRLGMVRKMKPYLSKLVLTTVY